jgi:hypothetical protein
VHLPSKLLRALDALAARTKASRNRLVIEASERLVHSNRGMWLPGFLEGAHLSTKDRKDLAAAGSLWSEASGAHGAAGESKGFAWTIGLARTTTDARRDPR